MRATCAATRHTLALGFATRETMLWNRTGNRVEYVCRGQGAARRVRFPPGGDLLLTTYEQGGTKTWLVQ